MPEDNTFYRSLLDNLSDGVYFVDRERKITYWNKGAERITGYSSEQVIGHSCADNLLMHVDDEGNYLCKTSCPLAKAMADGEYHEAEVYFHHANGHRVPAVVRVSPIFNPSGEATGAVEVFSDNTAFITALRRINELGRAVRMDPLTNIDNRRFIHTKIVAAISECQYSEQSAGLLFFDIDHFKRVNDTYGHNTGDEVLKMVAQTIVHNIRNTDSAGRWGGEEFIAVLLNVNPEGLLKTAEKLRVLVEHSHLTVGLNDIRVTISVGAALTRPDDTAEMLVKRADDALYQSKQNGRNRVTQL